jgi:hypothetical protein
MFSRRGKPQFYAVWELCFTRCTNVVERDFSLASTIWPANSVANSFMSRKHTCNFRQHEHSRKRNQAVDEYYICIYIYIYIYIYINAGGTEDTSPGAGGPTRVIRWSACTCSCMSYLCVCLLKQIHLLLVARLASSGDQHVYVHVCRIFVYVTDTNSPFAGGLTRVIERSASTSLCMCVCVCQCVCIHIDKHSKYVLYMYTFSHKTFLSHKCVYITDTHTHTHTHTLRCLQNQQCCQKLIWKYMLVYTSIRIYIYVLQEQ